MGVLIKGMKMPKACIDCDVHIAHDYCEHFAQFGTGPRKDGRYDDCPLVEIVRCGECKYWYKNSQSNTGGCSVMLSTGLYAGGFCSYGERRSDETN